MNNQKLFLFVALSMIIMFLWQAWEREQHPPTPLATEAARNAPQNPKAPADPTRDIPQPPGSPAQVVPQALETAGRTQVQTDVLRAEIDALGGDLRSLSLLQYPEQAALPDKPFFLLKDQGPELFVAQSGLIGNGGPYPYHRSRYLAERSSYVLEPGQPQLQVSLFWTEGGLKVTKRYTFHRNSYVIDVDYLVENRGKAPREAYLYAQFVRHHVQEQHSYLSVAPSYVGGVIYSPEKKYQKVDFAEMGEKPLQREITSGWIAMLQHYFVGAWLPDAGASNQFYSRKDQPGDHYVLGYKNLTPLRLAPGESGRLHTKLYAGPKEQARLEQAAPGLVLTVDYGWLTVVASPLYWILEHIHGAVGNWGWAIVILTFLIKLVFYPLSAASYRSMANMRRLQPRLQSLKERYGDDRQRMQQAMMELYKTEKLNPLGGCLPILIQIPVFIALYWVLLESVELRQAPFVLWIKDLSSQDPYYVLPILMGATMWAQQLLSPAPMDAVQKKVMMAMPLVFTVFFLFFPAGLVLYWLVNNVLSIAQQWWIMRLSDAKAKS